MPFCHKCGHSVEVGDKFCFECGTPVRNSQKNNENIDPETEKTEISSKVQEHESKTVKKQVSDAKTPEKKEKNRKNYQINKKALYITLSVIAVFFVCVITFAIYNNPTRAMIRRLKIGLRSTHIDYSTLKTRSRNEVPDYSKGSYISSYDLKDNEEVSLFQMSDIYSNDYSLFNYYEFRRIDNAIKEKKPRYVFYRKDDSSKKHINRTMLAFVEFKNTEDAMSCFDSIVDTYFGRRVELYSNVFKNSNNIYKEYNGTVMGNWMLKDSMDTKLIYPEDLDEKVYKRSPKEAYLNFRLKWDILVWGDSVRPYPNDADKIEAHSNRLQGVRAYYLSVKGNKLTLVCSCDLNGSDGELDDFKRICSSLRIDDMSGSEYDVYFKKYILWLTKKWNPFSSRIDMM